MNTKADTALGKNGSYIVEWRAFLNVRRNMDFVQIDFLPGGEFWLQQHKARPGSAGPRRIGSLFCIARSPDAYRQACDLAEPTKGLTGFYG